MKAYFGKCAATARDDAEFTQEQAAELLNTSTRTLSDYERGITLPPDDIVETMMALYNAPHLGYIWLRCNLIGYMLLPEIPNRQLSSSILDFQVEMNHANNIQMDLVEVGRDNKVEDHELPRWKRCKEELHDLIGAVFSILMTPKEKAAGLAHRRL